MEWSCRAVEVEKIAIVAGHADYYPRFGLSTEKAQSLESPFPVEAFMAIELSTGVLDGIQGSVMYPPALESEAEDICPIWRKLGNRAKNAVMFTVRHLAP